MNILLEVQEIDICIFIKNVILHLRKSQALAGDQFLQIFFLFAFADNEELRFLFIR